MTGETEEIAAELRDMALTASGNSLDRGCQNCGIAASVAETAADHIERQAAEIARLTAEVERLRPVYEHARGICFGVDWNKGTHAKAHRAALIAAVHAVEPLPFPPPVETGNG